KQKRNSPLRVGFQVAIVYAVVNGYLNQVPVSGVKDYEQQLYSKLENEYGELLSRFESGAYSDDDIVLLEKALGEMER
ncbi:MAG: F0F1 ATP synthase subunit alpha, partial [Clostridia bacterium]|nr:F0F1 ATP synthase subunit alpha [Clostridia bacterium]